MSLMKLDFLCFGMIVVYAVCYGITSLNTLTYSNEKAFKLKQPYKTDVSTQQQ